MIKLEDTFKNGAAGFGSETLDYKQICRNDKYAVYERSRDGLVKDYEVFEIPVTKAGTIQNFPGGKTKTIMEDMESYAVTSQWGKKAWSYHGLYGKENAIEKFEALTKESNTPKVVATPNAEYVPTGKHRGRVAQIRKEFQIPSGKFITKDLLALNTEYSQPQISIELKKLVETKRIQIVGIQKEAGKRGKGSTVYSTI